MYNEEEMILEESENVEEQTTEEIVEETEPVKSGKFYTDEELDSLIAKKIARKEAKIRKQYEREYEPYREAERILNAGLGTENIKDATENLRDFYTKKGVNIPTYSEPTYSDEDMKVLAEAEARRIIESGLDEVIEEVDRLAEYGMDNLTAREKAVFVKLAEYREQEETNRELRAIGVTDDVLHSDDFREFKGQFTEGTPITNIYEMYTKVRDKNKPVVIGSMKSGNIADDREIFTPEEVDRLSPSDYDDPKIMAKVRRSMLSW